MKTFGGKQLWTDQLHFRQWRIQRHAITGHHRLLDPQNWRHAWGSYPKCRETLNQIIAKRRLEPVTGDVIIVLHGLMRSRNSLIRMAEFLRENTDATVCNFEYASTRFKVAEHAGALSRVVENMSSAKQVHFVGHSLGNIVVRYYLDSRYQAEDTTGLNVPPPIGRMVMLGAPNMGTELARRFAKNPLFTGLWGHSGNQLAREWETLQIELATPRTEFGVIAGQSFGNPFLSSEGDFVVKVEETRLPGAADFMTVRGVHSTLMNVPEVQAATARFLKDGYFRSEAERERIE